MDNVMRDAKVGLRLLWKTPGFTAVAVLTLALGIAANTAIFSVIYATFFEPLPYRDADRLVMAWSRFEASREMVSARRFTAWKQHATVFEDLNAWTGRTASVSIGTRPEQLGVGPATPGFLPMLGYGHPLALGRDFVAEEGTPGRDQVVIVTHRIWRERLGSDPAIIGRQGPASEGFPEINVPFWQSPWPSTRMAVRTAVEPASVHQGIAAIVQSMDPDLPMADVKTMEQVVAESLVRDRFNTVLFGSFGLVGLLLAAIGIYGVMSCVIAQRTHEIGLRMALGAGRARIVRHIVRKA